MTQQPPTYGPSPHFNVDRAFVYHAPHGDQPERYQRLRAAFRATALAIENLCPVSAERTRALRKIQEAVMWANASIAINEKPEFSDVDTTPTKGDG